MEVKSCDGLENSKSSSQTPLIAIPEGPTLDSSGLRYYVDASTQYSPRVSTETVSPGALDAVTVREQEAPATKSHNTREAMQSPDVPVYKISSPSSALQFTTTKQGPSQGLVESGSSLSHANSSSLGGIAPTPIRARVFPARYEFCKVDDLVVLISDMISDLIRINDQLPLREDGLTRFHSKYARFPCFLRTFPNRNHRTVPKISAADFLQRLATHVTLIPPLLLAMIYYMDRLCALYPIFSITSLTIHRFLVAAATVASKGLSDSYYSNSMYARVGGIRVTELSVLELELLCRIEWKVVPCSEVLVDYYNSLVTRGGGHILEGSASPVVN